MTSGPMRHPCSDTGRLESDINRLENEVRRKADGYEISSLNSKVDALVSAVRDISSICDGILSRLQTCEENTQEIQRKLED